jgi:hypothetical protein
VFSGLTRHTTLERILKCAIMLIAHRTLHWKNGSQQADIAVRIFLPAEIDGVWSCRYEIDWPDRVRTKSIPGADSMQALLGALTMVGSEIVASTYYASGEMMLSGSYKGCGFPVPNSIRDVLRGDDAKFH